MIRHRALVSFLALALTAWAGPAMAQSSSPPAPAQAPPAITGTAYVVTYIEVDPAAASKTASVLRRYTKDTRQAAGNTAFLALREHERPGRFATVEAWKDKAALDAHASASKALAEQLQPYLIAPPDPRLSIELDVAPAPEGAKAKVFVLTHVDVIPSGKDEAIALVKELSAAGRKDDGNVFFNALTQANRANHMTLFEAWRDKDARVAYSIADHTKAFRRKLTPNAGALYDERIYEAVGGTKEPK